MFHYSSQNGFIFKEFLAVHGMKALKVVNVTVTGRLLHVASCKRFHGRYNVIIEALDSMTEHLKPELTG